MNPNNKRPAPDGFYQMAKGKSVNAMCMKFKANHVAVKRWFEEFGLTPARPPAPGRRLDPDGEFDTLALTLTDAALADHFNMSTKTVWRLRKERGIVRIRPATVAQKAALARQRRQPPGTKKGPVAAPDSQRDDSPFGLAADYLRMPRGGGWRVHRCDADGVFAPKGSHYRVGNMPVMTADEMMTMAERKGWKLVDIFSIAA